MSHTKTQDNGRFELLFILTKRFIVCFFVYIDPQLKRKQRRVLKRLFRYSRPDWPLITFGTILLLGAALCKYYLILIPKKSYFFLLFLAEVFVPLYTGRLLSSVAFKDEW